MSKVLLSVIITCLFLTSPSSAQVRKGSLVVFIVSQRADYVVIGAESRTLRGDDTFVDDRSCKVISLGGDTLFFGAGTSEIRVRQGESWNAEGTARTVYSSARKEGRDNPPEPTASAKSAGITIKRDANGRIVGVE